MKSHNWRDERCKCCGMKRSWPGAKDPCGNSNRQYMRDAVGYKEIHSNMPVLRLSEVMVEHPDTGEVLSAESWVTRLKVPKQRVMGRIHRGMSPQEAVFTPRMKAGRNGKNN